MATLASILAGVRDQIIALTPATPVEGGELPADAVTSDWDRFTHVFGRGNQALEQLLRDRVFVVIPTQGPTTTGCVSTVSVGVGVVYLDKEESAARMLDDVPLIQARLRTLASRIEGVTRSRPQGGPFYSFDTIPGACVVSFALDVEYCCDGGT